ncbi:RNA-directed DNA polymerase, eukaryota, reverse transcriptase zinc-binding domain protein [Tanacetum coccineum]
MPIHSTFHVSNLKKCLSDEPLAIPLDEITLMKVISNEEPVEIMDREVQAFEAKSHSNRKGPLEFKKRSRRFVDFQRGRGLRQGDLISPYLFTIVMEVFNMITINNIVAAPSFKYHYGCKELKLIHMCFADDLMVLCNGDKESLKVVKKSLEEFSCVLGLFPNLNKSIIFFRSINEDRKKELLEVLPFKYGKLPMKYLGIQLIALILSTMQQYWESVYMLALFVSKELDKLFKRFLQNSGKSTQGKARVACKIVCRPKEQGGLGIKHLKKWTELLLISQIGRLLKERSLYGLNG